MACWAISPWQQMGLGRRAPGRRWRFGRPDHRAASSRAVSSSWTSESARPRMSSSRMRRGSELVPRHVEERDRLLGAPRTDEYTSWSRSRSAASVNHRTARSSTSAGTPAPVPAPGPVGRRRVVVRDRSIRGIGPDRHDGVAHAGMALRPGHLGQRLVGDLPHRLGAEHSLVAVDVEQLAGLQRSTSPGGRSCPSWRPNSCRPFHVPEGPRMAAFSTMFRSSSGQLVEAGRHQPPERVGQPADLARTPSPWCQLLEEQRVATAAVEQLVLDLAAPPRRQAACASARRPPAGRAGRAGAARRSGRPSSTGMRRSPRTGRPWR